MPVPASSWFVIIACAFCCSPALGSQILRSTAGNSANLLSAAHYEARRSNTFCCGEASATCHCPVVSGHLLAASKCLNDVQSCMSIQCIGYGLTPQKYV